MIGIIFLHLATTLLVWSQPKPLYLERPYEPIVIYGGAIDAAFRAEAPINDLYLCAYDAVTQSWRVMPFQIDERFHTYDRYKPGKEEAKRHTYFIPDEDPFFDYDDELVFLAGDLGDQAPANSWIDDAESHLYGRVQITLTDPLDTDIKGYAYLYRSSTWQQPVPDKYQMSFDPATLTVSTYAYRVRMDEKTSMIRDIIFKPPFGSGVDIFDTQKIRAIGYINLIGMYFLFGKAKVDAANEYDNLYSYPEYLMFTNNPKVRVIVERRTRVEFSSHSFWDRLAFYITLKYYPNSGNLIGGADLDPEVMKKEWDISGTVSIKFDMIRQSWDFNSAAQGMKFYNAYNNGIPVDGIPDKPDTTLTVPIRQWNLCSGEQGTLFTYTAFEDTSWKAASLYYYDNKNGGQGDGSIIEGGDTGDGVSYGDMGFILYSSISKIVSLQLGFTAYFLPKNYTQADGAKLAQQVENKIVYGSYRQTAVRPAEANQQPADFRLLGSYPNPFNAETQIGFYIPQKSEIHITIIDARGCRVATLMNQNLAPGEYRVTWDGKDDTGCGLPSSVYFYRVVSGQRFLQGKLLLLR